MTRDMNHYWRARGRNYSLEFKNHNIIKRFIFWKQEREIQKILPKDVESVLEIGCGFGRITKLLLKLPRVKKVVAIDISEDQIKVAKENIKDSRVEFITQDVFDLGDDKFDLVIASEVLMHIPPERIKQLIMKIDSISKKYIINIDWFEPNKHKESRGYCWQHSYEKYGFNLVKKLYRQGIFMRFK